jgi:enamine deaminase RidA (YjgF/YER057c/UK114 family)
VPDHLNFMNPETLFKPPGYTQVVEITGPGRVVYIAGQLGQTQDGKLAGGPGDFRAQADQAFVNLEAALAAVGGGLEHVVKITNYLVDIKHLPLFREVRDAHLGGRTPPASTTMAISALAREGALFEIEAVAVLPPR